MYPRQRRTCQCAPKHWKAPLCAKPLNHRGLRQEKVKKRGSAQPCRASFRLTAFPCLANFSPTRGRIYGCSRHRLRRDVSGLNTHAPRAFFHDLEDVLAELHEVQPRFGRGRRGNRFSGEGRGRQPTPRIIQDVKDGGWPSLSRSVRRLGTLPVFGGKVFRRVLKLPFAPFAYALHPLRSRAFPRSCAGGPT